MVRANACDARMPALSVTWTVNGALKAVAVGVPLITPPGLRLKPAGRDPPAIAKAYGGVPPTGVRPCE